MPSSRRSRRRKRLGRSCTGCAQEVGQSFRAAAEKHGGLKKLELWKGFLGRMRRWHESTAAWLPSQARKSPTLRVAGCSYRVAKKRVNTLGPWLKSQADRSPTMRLPARVKTATRPQRFAVYQWFRYSADRPPTLRLPSLVRNATSSLRRWLRSQIDRSPTVLACVRIREELSYRYACSGPWFAGQIDKSPTLRLITKTRLSFSLASARLSRWMGSQIERSTTLRLLGDAKYGLTELRCYAWPWFCDQMGEVRNVRPLVCVRTACCIVALAAIVQVEAGTSSSLDAMSLTGAKNIIVSNRLNPPPISSTIATKTIATDNVQLRPVAIPEKHRLRFE